MCLKKNGFLVFSLLPLFCCAQVIYSNGRHALPKALYETSGLAIANGNVYSHNDGGNSPVIYTLNRAGQILDSTRVNGVTNFDWEDISYNQGKFYIAETGNNYHNRKDLKIYVLNDVFSLERTVRLRYKNQTLFPPADNKKIFDCEALLVRNDTAFMFSKTWAQPYTGVTYMYTLPLLKDSMQILSPVDSFHTHKTAFLDGSVTSCDLSLGNKYFALTTCNYLFVFFEFTGRNFLQGKYAAFRFESTSQREAIAFDSDSTFMVSDESWANMVGGNLYTYNLAPFMNGEITYTVPEVISYKVRKKNSKQYKIEIGNTDFESAPEVCLYNADGKVISQRMAVKKKNIFEAVIDLPNEKPAFVRVFVNKRMVVCRRWD